MKKLGRPPQHEVAMTRKSIFLTAAELQWLKNQPQNLSAIIRGMIDSAMAQKNQQEQN